MIRENKDFICIGLCPKCGEPVFEPKYWKGNSEPNIVLECRCKIRRSDINVSYLPVYKETSKNRVKCKFCGRITICRKYLEGWRLDMLRDKWHLEVTDDDWICCICESNLMGELYARDIAEGSP